MVARDNLRRVRANYRRIVETRERLRCLRSDRGEASPEAVIDLETRLEKQLSELCAVRLELMETIDRIDEPVLKEVLELYYLDGLSWNDVADRMHYSVRNVQILHKKALARVNR